MLALLTPCTYHPQPGSDGWCLLGCECGCGMGEVCGDREVHVLRDESRTVVAGYNSG